MSRNLDTHITAGVLIEVLNERRTQHAKWGEQNHPDGVEAWEDTVNLHYDETAPSAGEIEHCARRILESGSPTFLAILMEEVGEAMCEVEKPKLRAELVQVAAVAVAWIEKLDREMGR